MDINSVSSSTSYEALNATSTVANNAAATEQTKDVAATTNDSGVVYDKSAQVQNKATYSINKMSAEDRASLVQQLKEDQASREESLVNIVKQMMAKQAGTASAATGDINDLLKAKTGDEDESSFWKFIASGEYEVDDATRKQAQEDISEDGYWGVKQTSQRMFDFASALAGDDEGKMKQMQAAMQKGFDQATKLWGKELPQISQDTLAATNKLFEDYYASKSTGEA